MNNIKVFFVSLFSTVSIGVVEQFTKQAPALGAFLQIVIWVLTVIYLSIKIRNTYKQKS